MTTPNKVIKVDSMNALQEFNDYVLSIGATKEENWTTFSYVLQTVYGPLRISVNESDFTKTGKPRKPRRRSSNFFSSIYTCFHDFQKAKEYLKFVKMENFPTNGKVNYHLSGGDSEIQNWQINFERFKADIEELLKTV